MVRRGLSPLAPAEVCPAGSAPADAAESRISERGPGTGAPVVEVVVRRHAQTGSHCAFVLNKGGPGTGRLCGPDFENATLRDALSGEPASPDLALPAFGCRILEIGPFADR